MKAIRRNNEIDWMQCEECHDGYGTLNCKSLLDGCDSTKFNFMHRDEIKAGVSIGTHAHTDSEEIYYLISGKGILTYDDTEYEMMPGDISLCNVGHSHGFLATEDSTLIVVG